MWLGCQRIVPPAVLSLSLLPQAMQYDFLVGFVSSSYRELFGFVLFLAIVLTVWASMHGNPQRPRSVKSRGANSARFRRHTLKLC